VIELEVVDDTVSTQPPGWWVRYEDDPVPLGQSGDRFASLRGRVTLLMTVDPWMLNVDRRGYRGPSDIVPTNASHITKLCLVDDFEGQHTPAVGQDRERPFTVSMPTHPPRLVVDIAS
jgi:hypothetical protein